MQQVKPSELITQEPTQQQPQNQQFFEKLTKNKIKGITSSSISPNRKYFLITTDQGFTLVNPRSSHFTRFQGQSSPFFKNQHTKYGVALGSILQQRSQVALVPDFDSKKFKSTAIYIYDYSIKIFLSTFDFVLPIKQFSLTDRYLIVSNNKRIILYNYLKGTLKDSEEYYIQAYRSDQNIDSIRYLALNCHQYSQENPCICECGTFKATRLSQYLKIFFVRVEAKNVKKLQWYDQAEDRIKDFEGMPTNDFEYSVTEDGRYLSVVQDYGRKIKVYNLAQNMLQTVLRLSRDPGSIINLGVFTIDKSQWLLASRQKQNDEATMHLFKLGRTPPTEPVQSNFKRYFRLYKHFSVSEGIFSGEGQFIGPEYYLSKQKLFCLAMEGQFCQIIDLGRAGLHQKVTIKDYRRLQQSEEFQF